MGEASDDSAHPQRSLIGRIGMTFAWLDAPSTAESASWTGGVAPAGAARAQRAASVAATHPGSPPDGCYRCHQEIYVSFFFDGFGHDALRESASFSNIGLLYHAHEETNSQAGIYKLYFEGMGRRLSDNPAGVSKALGQNSLNQAKGIAKSNFLTGPFKKGAQSAAKEILKDWKGGHVSEKVKSSMLDAFNPKKVLENLRKPANAIPLIISSGASVIADSVPAIRDSEISAAYLGTGFAARVEKAKMAFTDVVALAKADPRPLRTIRISMFGFDSGGVIARKFANDLINTICKSENGALTYQGVQVQFDYMGLIDCVSSAYAESLFTKALSPVLSFVPGEGWVAKITTKGLGIIIGLAKRSLGQYDTPAQFTRVTHHVAATELRFYKNLDSPRDSKNVSNLVEIVYPGSQADVGGGLTDGADDKSAELPRVSAQNMLNEGWSFGVPLQRIDRLETLGRFDILKQLAFRKTVNVNGKDCNVGDLFAAYTAALNAGGRAPLERHLLAHQKLFIAWARTLHDRIHGPAQGHLLFVNTVDADVYNAIFTNDPTPQYDAREAYYERVAQGTEHSTPFYTSRQVDQITDPTIRELATAWVKPPKLSLEVIAFFDHFVHNTVTIMNNVSLGDGVFMQLRTIERSGVTDRIEQEAATTAKAAASSIGKVLSEVPPDYPITY
jgi:hypothetical protein